MPHLTQDIRIDGRSTIVSHLDISVLSRLSHLSNFTFAVYGIVGPQLKIYDTSFVLII